MAKSDLDIRMLIEVTRDRGSDFFHVIAYPVKWIYRDYESDRGWRIDRGFDYDEPAFNHLQVRAQGDVKSEPGLTGADTYAWSVEYHEVYRVLERDAAEMARVLRRINRKLEQLASEFGWPENIGQYIARVANALGISAFGFYPPSGQELWASGERIRWDNAAHLDSMIRTRIEELREAR